MFKTLIFSKNRACQCELLLRSLNIPTTVLYTYDPEFRKGYLKLKKMYPKVKFLKETNFKNQVLRFVKTCRYILFLTDDDVMISPFSTKSPEFKKFKNDKNVASLSLGLSAGVAGRKWEWRKFRGSYRLRMWGYPMSVDSCIFRSKDILSTIKTNGIKNPNYLETYLNKNIPSRPMMMCFNKPKLVNNSVNQVQLDFPAHTSGPTPQELESRFLKGERLSLGNIKKLAKGLKHYRIKVPYMYESALNLKFKSQNAN